MNSTYCNIFVTVAYLFKITHVQLFSVNVCSTYKLHDIPPITLKQSNDFSYFFLFLGGGGGGEAEHSVQCPHSY